MADENQAVGTFDCPICGESGPHQHSGDEIVDYRKCAERGDEPGIAVRHAARLLRREAKECACHGAMTARNAYLRYAKHIEAMGLKANA